LATDGTARLSESIGGFVPIRAVRV